jgi:hypothetical protein
MNEKAGLVSPAFFLPKFGLLYLVLKRSTLVRTRCRTWTHAQNTPDL